MSKERRAHQDINVFDGPDRCVCRVETSTGAWNIKGGPAPKHWGQCSRQGKLVLRSTEGTMHFCTAHAKLALAGFVSERGDIMCAADRANCRRYDIEPTYIGTWSNT